ncbi:hypothetical protein HanIR_Chr14g0682561 [Helianthus annuus]|nr:hypothetical protein HanIR_Chr14g0682561 [Helianthus annuus]
MELVFQSFLIFFNCLIESIPGIFWTFMRQTERVIRVNHQFRGKHDKAITHSSVGTTVKLLVKPVWLKDPTHISQGILSLTTRVSLCIK